MKRALWVVVAVAVAGRAAAQQACPTEVKVILDPAQTRAAVGAFGLTKQVPGAVYFFDTDSRDLSKQGAVIRLRQGGKNDLTVKLRPAGSGQATQVARLRSQFPCEIDRTPLAAIESYAIARPYAAGKLAAAQLDVRSLLTDAQQQLLSVAGVVIQWPRVHAVAVASSTQWSSGRASAYGKLALELWEWPGGRILEISAKESAQEEASNPLDLQALVTAKGLTASPRQDTKTSMLLSAPTAAVPAVN